MSIEKMYAVIEAVLFTMGESVETAKLAAAIEQDVSTTVKLMHNLMDRYEAEDRGIKIIELGDSFQLCTKPETYEYLIKVAAQPKKQVLTDVLLETLSIIAYKQPITKQEIEGIRGVSCDHAVNKLVEYGLVDEVGRLDAPGRPILFGTTESFLRSFGVRNVDELPVISPDKVEDFRKEAESETEGAQKQEASDEKEAASETEDDVINLGI
jgi:segregation and condensation protein B